MRRLHQASPGGLIAILSDCPFFLCVNAAASACCRGRRTENTGSKLASCHPGVCSMQPAQFRGKICLCSALSHWAAPSEISSYLQKVLFSTKTPTREQASINVLNSNYGYFQPLYSHKFLSGCNPWSTATFLKLLALLTLHQIKSCLCHPVFCNAFFLQSESLYISTKTKQCPLVVRALCPHQKAHFRTNGGLSEKICAIQLHSSEIIF